MQTPNSGVTAPVSYARHPPWDSRAVHVAFHSAGRTVVPARKIKSCLGWTSNSTNCCDTMLCSRAVRTPASFDTRQRNDSKSYISLLLIVSSSVLPWEKFRTRRACDLRQREWMTGETDVIFPDISPPPPPPPPPHRYSLVFCPKGNTRDWDCQVKFTPEELPLHTLRRKTTQFFLTLSKKQKTKKKTHLSALLSSWEINCHHYAAGASVLQTSAADGSCCQAFISVCLQNTVTASHTRVHFAELTASERFSQVRAAPKPRKWTLLWSLRHSGDLWSASVGGSEAHL